MPQPAHHYYDFGHFRLNPVEHQLLRDGESVPLPPKVFDLLYLLVQNHGRLLEKEEMTRAIWPDTFVEEGNLTRYISTLRQVLGESAKKGQYILTVAKLGYRFVASVRKIAVEHIDQARPLRSDLVVRSMAILPFKSLAIDDRDQALELGMADVLITKLGSSSRVIIKSTSEVRRYGNLDQNIIEAGRELKVETVLDGSIQKSGEKIRVTTRLINVEDGIILFAAQFDETLTDNFSLQDSITGRIVETLLENRIV